MELNRIYFDLDGVLADFRRGIAVLAGTDEQHDDEMWEAVSKVDSFYARLDPLPGALEMFAEAQLLFPGSCEILSAPPKPKRGVPDAEKDKREWCERHLGTGVPVNIAFSEDKHLYCGGASDVLVDDRESNIADWEAAGGTGILHISPEETLQELRRLLEI